MGQYYRFIFLSESGEILHWIDSYDFHCSKMMEFAWQGGRDSLCEAAEAMIAGSHILSNGNFHGVSKPKYRVVCAGDYGAPEPKAADSIWTQKKTDLETYCTAVKTAKRHCLDGIDYKEAEQFLAKSPLEYTDADRAFGQRCLNAWYAHETDKNLYHMCDDLPDLKIKPAPVNGKWYPYIVNHSRKEFVDKRKNSEYGKRRGGDESSDEDNDMLIHPLPLLVSETAGGGGGDYRGKNESDVGCWARDLITMESQHPGEEYKEFIVGFREC
jgi:hypothetical protein